MILLKQAIKVCNLQHDHDIVTIFPINGKLFQYHCFTLKNLRELFDMKKTKVYKINFDNDCFEFMVNTPWNEIEQKYFKLKK